MTEVLTIVVLILLFGAFLYWGYLPDYRRNPQAFWRTLIGMPIGILLGVIGFEALNEKIKKWANESKKGGKTKEYE